MRYNLGTAPAFVAAALVLGSCSTGELIDPLTENLRPIVTLLEHSEFRNSTTWGVIKLDLVPTGYSWSYITTPNGAVIDSGSETCH